MLACAGTAGPGSRHAQKKHDPRSCGGPQQHLQQLQRHRATLILERTLRPNLELGFLRIRLLGELGHEFRAFQGGPVLLVEIVDDRLELRCVEGFDAIHRGLELAHLSLTLGGDLLLGDGDQAVARDERGPNHEKKSDRIHKGHKGKEPHDRPLDRERHDPRKGKENSQGKKRDGSPIHQAAAETKRLEGTSERIGQKLEDQVDCSKGQKTVANDADNLRCGRVRFHGKDPAERDIFVET